MSTYKHRVHTHSVAVKTTYDQHERRTKGKTTTLLLPLLLLSVGHHMVAAISPTTDTLLAQWNHSETPLHMTACVTWQQKLLTLVGCRDSKDASLVLYISMWPIWEARVSLCWLTAHSNLVESEWPVPTCLLCICSQLLLIENRSAAITNEFWRYLTMLKILKFSQSEHEGSK